MSEASLVGLIAGLLSGVLGSVGALWAYAHGYLRLEQIELRRSKLRLVEDLVSCRYAINSSYSATETDAFYFNTTMAKIPYVFSGEKAVMEAYEAFLNDVKNVEKLVHLIRVASASADTSRRLSDTNARRAINVDAKAVAPRKA